MGRFKVLTCAVSFVAGIYCAAERSLAVIVIVIVIAALAGAAATPASLRPMLWVATIAFVLGFGDAYARGNGGNPQPDKHLHRFAATVSDERLASDGATTLTVRLADGALATFDVREAAPAVGTRLLIRGKRDVFDEPRNPGEPSERELAAERGIHWRLVKTTILQRGPPDPWDATLWLPRARAAASQRLHATVSEPQATILAGALWGERGALPPDLRAEFQDTGTVHILVTAGLHLGVVAALALALLRTLGAGRISSALTTIAIVWVYASFSGGHLPSLRAATMATFGLAAYALGREALTPNALGAAAIVITATDPAAVHSLSFALSFSCVASILGFTSPIARMLGALALPRFATQLLAVSLATQIGTWPLTAAGFLTIAPYAPIANALVVPSVGVAMLAGFAAVAAAPVPILGEAAANVATSLLDWILGCVRIVSALPGAHVNATPPPTYAVVAYELALAGAAIALATKRYILIACVVVAGAAALCLWPPRQASQLLRITVIDVGQADAILIETPAGHAFLVDAGGRLERGGSPGNSASEAIGERIVVPFLIRRGIHHLDAVLASHPHGDHVGGIAPALRTLGADAFADSGQSYPGHAYHDALDAARRAGVPMLEPRAGDILRTPDGVRLRFYGPSLPYITGSRSDINSNSLVFRLEYRDFSMLFTGDAGAETEQRLLARGDDLRADVLKVGHHGSAYGSTPAFLRAVQPRYAVISVGRHNLFGHPAPQTIAALRAAGAAIFRTDENGAVSIRSDGHSVALAPMLAAPSRP